MEELEEVMFSPDEHEKNFKIGKLMSEPLRTRLIEFIWGHKGDFAWNYHDIPGIDPLVMVHKLNIDWEAMSIKQKRRSFHLEWYKAINTKIDKLIKAKGI